MKKAKLESTGVEERKQELIKFLKGLSLLPKYKQFASIRKLQGKILSFPADQLNEGQSYAILRSHQIFGEFGDDFSNMHLLQIAERINWILAEMTGTGRIKLYRSLFEESEDGNFPRSIHICHDYLHQIGSESRNLIPNLEDPETQHRLIFGPKRKVPSGLEKLRIKLFSSEIGKPIISKLLKEMQRISNSRVIDREVKKPQLGFGRELTLEELEDAASQSGAYLVVISNGDENFHFSMVLTEETNFTSHATEMMKVLYKEGEISSYNKHAWLEYIVSSKSGSELLKTFGISTYGMSCYFTSILLAFKNIPLLYCTCRSGEWANTVIQKSLKHGFEDTGIEISPEDLGDYTQDPAKVLRYDPYRLERVVEFVDNHASHDKGVFFSGN